MMAAASSPIEAMEVHEVQERGTALQRSNGPMASSTEPGVAAHDILHLTSSMRHISLEPSVQVVVADLLAAAAELQSHKQGINAEQCYSGVLALQPDSLAALQGLGKLWLAADKPLTALAYAQRALDAAADEPAAHQLVGDCQLAAGQVDAAVGSYQSALALLNEVCGNC